MRKSKKEKQPTLLMQLYDESQHNSNYVNSSTIKQDGENDAFRHERSYREINVPTTQELQLCIKYNLAIPPKIMTMIITNAKQAIQETLTKEKPKRRSIGKRQIKCVL